MKDKAQGNNFFLLSCITTSKFIWLL